VQASERSGAWPDPAEFDALLVFGGSMSSLDDDGHPYLAEERDLLRRAVDLGVPTLGVCLGGQLLAQALGGRVARAPRPEVGFKPLSLTRDAPGEPSLAAFPSGSLAFQWHEDAFEVPAGATLLATGQTGGPQAFRVGSALGIQFHPEIEADELETWITSSGQPMTSVWGRDPDEFRREIAREIDAHNERGRAFFQTFAREALRAGARRSA
jgi:GMP synthase (glutamine-hydrolysing)